MTQRDSAKPLKREPAKRAVFALRVDSAHACQLDVPQIHGCNFYGNTAKFVTHWLREGQSAEMVA